ncbi:piggyBac transposable element-derived protein 4-like [Belonocnema kinseyi]|uniref:piggyBac transposable element-derived protein 4-like n=1 Tax=Belonocnema kinseyi TaxID=2817044 RepID=UPI00143D0DA2|nr:piggyBac transposable element-derived protein 4-like [Belonocnema kinseyi]
MATLAAEEWIRAELERLDREEPFGDESSEEIDSEDENASLPNNDDIPDEFILEDDETSDPIPHHIPAGADSERDRDFLLGKDGETIWTTATLKQKTSKTPRKNIISHLPGAKEAARTCSTELSFFKLFLSEPLIEMIVCHTDEEIARRQALVPNSERYAGQTDTMEIEALIGFLLLCGATKNSDLKLSELFSRKFSIPFYRCVTSLNRMKFLISHLRFDSKETRVDRKRNDKFAPFREFWDIFIASCGKYYTPSEYETADETLLSFRGRCPFKMYLPNKPDKYGHFSEIANPTWLVSMKP